MFTWCSGHDGPRTYRESTELHTTPLARSSGSSKATPRSPVRPRVYTPWPRGETYLQRCDTASRVATPLARSHSLETSRSPSRSPPVLHVCPTGGRSVKGRCLAPGKAKVLGPEGSVGFGTRGGLASHGLRVRRYRCCFVRPGLDGAPRAGRAGSSRSGGAGARVASAAAARALGGRVRHGVRRPGVEVYGVSEPPGRPEDE